MLLVKKCLQWIISISFVSWRGGYPLVKIVSWDKNVKTLSRLKDTPFPQACAQFKRFADLFQQLSRTHRVSQEQPILWFWAVLVQVLNFSRHKAFCFAFLLASPFVHIRLWRNPHCSTPLSASLVAALFLARIPEEVRVLSAQEIIGIHPVRQRQLVPRRTTWDTLEKCRISWKLYILFVLDSTDVHKTGDLWSWDLCRSATVQETELVWSLFGQKRTLFPSGFFFAASIAHFAFLTFWDRKSVV